MAQLLQERRVRTAAEATLTRSEMVDELKLVYMDACRAECVRLGWPLARHYYSPRDRCFIQCVGHKMKNFVQNLASLAASGESAFLDAAALLSVARVLAEKQPAVYNGLVAALTKTADMQGEDALAWLLICPAFLDELWARGHEKEYATLEAVAMGYLACDMPGLNDATRTMWMEMLNSLLVYNIAGDQLYMPFGGGDKREEKGRYLGVREGKIGGSPAQNLLAFVSNAGARAHLRNNKAVYAGLVELSFNHRDVENYFSQLAQQLGYKPAARMLERRCQQVDWSTQVMYEEDLGFVHMRRKRSMYSHTQKVLARGKLNKVVAWNDGSALGDRYYPKRDNPYNNKVEKRAAHDARTYTKVNTVRSHHKGGVNVDPSGAPQAL